MLFECNHNEEFPNRQITSRTGAIGPTRAVPGIGEFVERMRHTWVDKALVFISCGQFEEAEKKLGADLCALIRQVRPDLELYFAESQTTAEGLSNQYRRGDINTTEGRTVGCRD